MRNADDFSRPLSVSRLVLLLQELVEDNFVQVLVEGEISNFSAPASGHLYLTLKDAEAQIRAVMFRSQARRLRFVPENGLQVVCRGRVAVYRQRGELQLVLDGMEPQGLGGLQLAFEQLKRKLEAEGLFAEARKRPLPAFPRRIGIVTSPTGAAIRDMLNVLRRRSGGIDVLLCPVRVQGEEAAAEIARGIADLNRVEDVDIIIVGRGGGSMEDLWAFNEEVVARAIAASPTPVVSAVGHETDWTIADFVADLRAPTPSAAAELVVKNRLELESHIDHLLMRLQRPLRDRLRLLQARVEGLRRRLLPPKERLRLQNQRLDELRRRLLAAWGLTDTRRRERLALLSARLDLLSPLQTLGRGYSIVFRERDGKIVRRAGEVAAGEKLRVRLHRGELRAVVEKTSS
ncbi:exodeoxyribonuclease VII large subunit [Geothermobacter ehrlichii]|uniref:Exodeoxyribonuclease 7 large subunit n=1 Tax=Geothermobacter ehrlichii TaxID=213224 RepID=A0A5D3WIP4_9BACT|nr:exodeoxyribonuclease VII large subunit [Geothermobacter ehrlichii]TYO98749.1 exodeoxyribonuclease VII large subunit [Geothermobacter ehrlichii]